MLTRVVSVSVLLVLISVVVYFLPPCSPKKLVSRMDLPSEVNLPPAVAKKASSVKVTESKVETKADGSKVESNTVTELKLQPKWRVTGEILTNPGRLRDMTPTYGVGMERRLGDSPFFLGGKVTSDKKIGLTISVELR